MDHREELDTIRAERTEDDVLRMERNAHVQEYLRISRESTHVIDVRRLNIGPNDLVIFTTEGTISTEKASKLREAWNQLMSGECRVLVIDKSLTMTVADGAR